LGENQSTEQMALRVVPEARATDSTADAAGPAEERPDEPASRKRASRPRPLQEFFIPVHGLVRVDKAELEIIDHPAFQRLGFIYQLGQAYLVYRGATHTRYEHALGTRHVIELLIEALNRNNPKEVDRTNRDGEWILDARLNDEEKLFLRLGALLHDIGHVAAGHTLEDELGLLDSHDRAERLADVLDRTSWAGEPVAPTLREVIDRRFAEEASRTGLRLKDGGRQLEASEIVELLIGKEGAVGRERAAVAESATFRTQVCRDLIGNTICADLLDYLHRDWYHIGKPRFFDTRLLEYLEIRRHAKTDEACLLINLRSGHRIRTDAVTAILDLLESRYQLAEIALFHRTKNSAAAMLERAIAEIAAHHPDGRDGLLKVFKERLLDASDAELLSILEDLARAALKAKGSKLDAKDQAALEGAMRLTHSLRVRRIHKHLTSEFAYQLHRATELVQDMYSGAQAKRDATPAERQELAREGARNRLDAVRLLESDFGMPPGSIVMYCPPRTMNTKIAEVRVLINDHVYKLDDFELTNGDRGITGGHLAAQKNRFLRLWRVQFGISQDQLERLRAEGLLQLLGRAIQLCVLGTEPSVGTAQEERDTIAAELAKISVRDDGEQGARAARQHEALSYPTGLRGLRGTTA
jgi:HD superfamily phosphohydrolase